MNFNLKDKPSPLSPIRVNGAIVDGHDGLVTLEDRIYFHFAKYQWFRNEPDRNPRHCEHQRRVEKRLAHEDLTACPNRQLEKACLLGLSPFSNNYFHFVTEIIPACLLKPDLPLLIGEDFPDVFLQFLSELGIVCERMTKERLECRELWIPSGGEWSLESAKWIRLEIFSRLNLSHHSFSQQISRVYVSRALAPRRHLVNEEAIGPLLKKHGVQKVHFEHYSILEQIGMISCAEWFIAPHGAGLSNILFMPNKGKILEIRPSFSSGQFCFEKLAKSLDLSYEWVLGAQQGQFQVQVETLEKVLERWF